MPEDSALPLVSVVIPHYGGTDILSECLTSLGNCSYSNLEIIVIDNASPDDSVPFVKSNFPAVKLIQSEYNRGFAGGCNFGVQHTNGKYLLILNNDTIHEPDWIAPLVHKMESNPEISAVQPKIKNYDQQEYFDYAGASGGYVDWLVFPFARGRIFDTVEMDEKQYDSSDKIFWASGTAFLTRTSIFKELGGFDEILFAHMEEIDYHWKSQIIGNEIWVVPDSVIYHRGAVTLPKSSAQKTYLNHRNSLVLLLTNKSLESVIVALFPRMMLELAACLGELLKLNNAHFLRMTRLASIVLGTELC